jgi:hypothetical protein
MLKSIALARTLAMVASVWLPQVLAATPGVEQEVTAMEQKLASADVPGRRALYADALIDIHGSGWLYTRDESLAISQNGAERRVSMKVLKASKLDYRIIPHGKDVAVVTWISETYFEVPNPQDLSRKAGTLLNDAASQSRAAAQMQKNAYGPGDAPPPNPLRTRMTRVWVRDTAGWKVVLQQGSRVGERSNFVADVIAEDGGPAR